MLFPILGFKVVKSNPNRVYKKGESRGEGGTERVWGEGMGRGGERREKRNTQRETEMLGKCLLEGTGQP